MDDYKTRLIAAMAQAGIDKSTLAGKLGISYQAVVKVITGKSACFDTINNIKAARLLDVTSDWLAIGEGAVTPHAPALPIVQADKPDRAELIAGMSALALELGLLFDELPNDRIVRNIAYQACNQELIKMLGRHGAKPIDEPVISDEAKKQPVERRVLP